MPTSCETCKPISLTCVSHRIRSQAKVRGASAVPMPSDKLAEAFKRFDADSNGFLDESELAAAFAAVGQPATPDVIHHSFSLLDKNHDGRISLSEFKDMATQNIIPALAQSFMNDNDHLFEANDIEFSDGQRRRDEKLAQEDPKAYCADRCLATGYCDVIEDIYEMTTTQVQKFCEHCGGADECELSYA